MIELRNISKTYKTSKNIYFQALKDVNLKIETGDFIAIVGASGSGKSTLLNIIGLLDDYDSGDYILNEKNVNDMSEQEKANMRNSCIGFVLQDFGLISDQTVSYNVSLPQLFGNAPFKEIKKNVALALNRLGIEDQASKKANELSGGQKQRVAIARALVNSPKIILADEPTGQLDSKTGLQIMELLKELNNEGITIVVVTHDEKVSSFAKKVITVSDGKINTHR